MSTNLRANLKEPETPMLVEVGLLVLFLIPGAEALQAIGVRIIQHSQIEVDLIGADTLGASRNNVLLRC
jgi:hypothetical protein